MKKHFLTALLCVCAIVMCTTQIVATASAAPAPPAGVALDTRSETVVGVSNLMEYSTNGTKWTGITASPLSIANLIPAATARNDIALSVRLKAANGAPASLPVIITLPRRPATPDTAVVKFDGFTESITATDLMEYRIGASGAFTAVPGGETRIPANVGASSQSYQVRVRATDLMFASAARSVTVPARRAAPNSVYNGSTDMITGVSTAMEYSLNNGSFWTPISTSSILRNVFGTDAITVMIRLKATATAPYSNIKYVSVPAAATTYPVGAALDTRGETVVGVSNLMEYSTNGTRWTGITAATLNVANMIPAATARNDIILSIRLKAANGAPASLPVIITLPRRPATPDTAAVKFDGFTESIAATDLITGVSTAMEYSLNNGSFWTPISTSSILRNVFGTDAITVMIRVKATSTAPSSSIKEVSVPKA